jgi:hypothetical protein
MTKEEMIAEFGEPGVENAKVIDLITVDPSSGKLVLVMVERRAWGASPRQLQEIEEKINRYMGYVLDGFLVQHHPEHQDKPVLIRLECAEEPHGVAVKFVQAAGHAIAMHGLEFEVKVTAPAAAPPP